MDREVVERKKNRVVGGRVTCDGKTSRGSAESFQWVFVCEGAHRRFEVHLDYMKEFYTSCLSRNV